MAKYCVRCQRSIDRGAKSLCLDCYKTRKEWQPKKIFICPKCNRETEHIVNGLCRSCNSAEYNKEHRAEVTIKERKRRSENRERYREIDRKRNLSENRKDWKRSYREVYYEKNKQYLQAYNREWMRVHNIEMNHYHAVRQTRKKNLPHTLTRSEWNEILEEHGHRCFYCGKASAILHKEHKIPISRGGGFTKENIVPACGSCNSQKSFRTPEEFEEYLKSKR